MWMWDRGNSDIYRDRKPYPQTKDPSARNKQNKCSRREALEKVDNRVIGMVGVYVYVVNYVVEAFGLLYCAVLSLKFG